MNTPRSLVALLFAATFAATLALAQGRASDTADARSEYARLRHGKGTARRHRAGGGCDGNFIIGPTHTPRRKRWRRKACRRGDLHLHDELGGQQNLSRHRTRRGDVRDARSERSGQADGHHQPSRSYTRRIAVYVPKQYVPGTSAPFIVGADGPDPVLFTGAGQSDRAEARAGDDCDLDRQRQWRCAGQPARARIRHDVRTLRGVRRDRSAAAGGTTIRREADEGSRRPRDDGQQLRAGRLR